MKKLLPWAAIVALLIGLALLPGPKAGAVAPLPGATGTSSSTCVGTSCVVTISTTTSNATGMTASAFLYAYNPKEVAISGFPAADSIVGDTTFTFTITMPCSTTSWEIDMPVSWDGFKTWVDIALSGTLPDACTTPTTTPTTVPTTTPPASVPPVPSVGLPPDGPAPVATPPATVQAPLAFTGAPILPEVGVALCLIALGLLLVRRSVRHA